MASARRGPRAASVMAEPFPEPADDAPFAVGGVVERDRQPGADKVVNLTDLV